MTTRLGRPAAAFAATGLLLCGAARSTSAAPITGPYISLGAGIDLQQDETREPIAGLEPKREVHFDLPGFAGNTRAGWGFGNGLRVELEGNYLNDHVRKITYPGDPLQRAGGYQQQYGGFANVLYDIPVALPVAPYIGVGVGGQTLELDNVNSSTPGFQFPHQGGSPSIGSFAYQAIAGVSIPVPRVRGLTFTLEYDFIGLADGGDTIPVRLYDTVLLPVPVTRAASNPFSPSSVLPTFKPVTEEIKARQQVGNAFHHSILFGLRYAFGAARLPSPSPIPVSVAPPPVEARTYLVFFDWDRSDLTPRAREIVAEAAQTSTHVRTTRIEVDGHADTSSVHGGGRGAAYNQGVSVRRTDSVRAELIRDGVPAAAIDTRGYGETRPLVATGPNQREPQNRRVEIILR